MNTIFSSTARLSWICIGLLFSWHGALADDNRMLRIERQSPDGPVWLTGTGSSNSVFRLERSTDLMNWQEWLQLVPGNSSFRVQDGLSSGWVARYFRFSTTPRAPADDWKNQVTLPTDPFLAEVDEGQIRWIKFLILQDHPDRVYFQDSRKYILHYEFAKARIPRFAGLSRTEFDSLSIHLDGQQAVLGTLLLPPDPGIREFGIQFAGQDPYPVEWVAKYFSRVLEAVDAPDGAKSFYVPAYEQKQAAQMGEEALKARGIPLGSIYRWSSGDQVYASGWATGTLRFIPASAIPSAYAEGRLKPVDILLTDGIPAELPFVAGILTFAPATPNSHVAVFAGANDIPFAYVADETRRQAIQRCDGHEIIFRAATRYGYQQVTVVDVEGQLDASTRLELIALKSPIPARVTPKESYGRISARTDVLLPQDRRYFGGKAANYGILRRMIPEHSEPAIAFSFDLWDAFMDQIIPGNGTLRDVIRAHLSPYTNYPPDISALQASLSAVRELITDVATFTPDQQQAIIGALSPFEPGRKIRFRSSSNAEDSRTFVGAGLYDSYSGCLLDDLDQDTKGPCRCDSTESKERGVFRAIQKAYASFYNENAFLERLRHGIDESQVAMGLLVHHSAPDETEMANGVAKMYHGLSGWGRRPILAADLVTQSGAVSVTNPDGGALPEVVHITESGPETPGQESTLVPRGTTVLAYPADYLRLFDLMKTVYTNYQALAGDTPSRKPLLDFEYKKIEPGWLQLKQVRELPQDDGAQVDPYLVNEPTTYWVFNCEQTSAMANHRLKSYLTLETRNVRLTGTNLDLCFYTDGRFEYRLGNEVHVLTGAPSSWPSASHSVTQTSSGREVRDSWTVGAGAGQRTCVLTTLVPTVNAADGLVITSRDLSKRLDVRYASAQPEPDRPPTVTNSVRLVMAPNPATLSPGQAETIRTDNLSIALHFLLSSEVGNGLYPTAEPLGDGEFPAYYSSWAYATITGLIAEPIILKDYFATTCTLGHKGRFRWFVFEPAADPSLHPTQIQALESANIRLVHVYHEEYSGASTVSILGTDGVFRRL